MTRSQKTITIVLLDVGDDMPVFLQGLVQGLTKNVRN